MIQDTSQCLRSVAASACVATMFLAPIAAQCTHAWLPGVPLAGTNGPVRATTRWDPDGAGPAAPLLVLGGEFTLAGGTAVQNIATHDAVTDTWSALGSGMPGGGIRALTVMPNGDLIAAGAFPTAGGGPANSIARWDGAAWSPLGAGINGGIHALTVLPNGDLVAGGQFQMAGGVAASGIAKWDGTAWAPLGGGIAGQVYALATMPNGDLVVGGVFGSAGGVPANCIARWNGATWAALGAGVLGAVVTLQPLPNGDVVAGGSFATAGGIPVGNIARWNGAAWSPLATGFDNSGGTPGTPAQVAALARLPNGAIVAGGRFTNAGTTVVNGIAMWNGVAWSPFGEGMGAGGYSVSLIVWSLTAMPGGEYVAAGEMRTAGDASVSNIARWNLTRWVTIGAGASGTVRALLTLPNGDLVAGGLFRTMRGVVVNHVARWDGSTWHAFGSGMHGSAGRTNVLALALLPNGDLVAGGSFAVAGGVTANNIARWNGATWAPLGSGTDLDVWALAALPNGDVVAGGLFHTAGGVPASRVAQWNGSAWAALGTGVSGPPPYFTSVAALAILPTGHVVVGGTFTSAGGVAANSIASWDGANWAPLGAGVSSSSPFGGFVNTLHVTANAELIAGGSFHAAGAGPANNIARWDGATWAPLGTGQSQNVAALAALPDGDVVAGGHFATPGALPLARWNGVAWSAMAPASDDRVHALAMAPGGTLAVGGEFRFVGSAPSATFALLGTSCPATASASGAGCIGAGGANVLAATSQPWIGATYSWTASGMPPLSLAIGVRGFSTVATPLSTILPQGAPGCTLHVSPDSLAVHVPAGGVVGSSFAIPDDVALVGQVLHQQVVALELDPAAQILASTSTNALALTLGSF